MRSRAGRITLIVLGVLIIVGLIAAWVMFLPPFRVAEQFAEPEFCASCHVMEPQYEAWQASSHNHLESCNDCHRLDGAGAGVDGQRVSKGAKGALGKKLAL